MHFKPINLGKEKGWIDGFLTEDEEKIVIESEKIKQVEIAIDCFQTAKAIRKQLLTKEFTIDELQVSEIAKMLFEKRASHIIYAIESSIVAKYKK